MRFQDAGKGCFSGPPFLGGRWLGYCWFGNPPPPLVYTTSSLYPKGLGVSCLPIDIYQLSILAPRAGAESGFTTYFAPLLNSIGCVKELGVDKGSGRLTRCLVGTELGGWRQVRGQQCGLVCWLHCYAASGCKVMPPPGGVALQSYPATRFRRIPPASEGRKS